MNKTLIQSQEQLAKLLLANKQTLTFSELCDYTGYSDSALYKMCARRQIPHGTLPGRRKLFFDREKIDEWLLRNSVPTEADLEAAAASYVAVRPLKGGAIR